MTLEIMHNDMMQALKNGDTQKKNVLSNMIGEVQKAAITPKGRIEITEELVNNTLIKYQKMIQEMIDTCPENRKELFIQYNLDMAVVKQYAPQLLTDKETIKTQIEKMLAENKLDAIKANKGRAMKLFAPVFKGKADMKIVNQIVSEVMA